jgi:ApaG protein
MYKATTHDIAIYVEPEFLDHESIPDEGVFVWAYHVKIENKSLDVVQLESRHWHITDALGRIHEVKGVGVVGEQPILSPGESFEYTSGTPLSTPSGIMKGTYRMTTLNGKAFDVEIPVFSLDSPHEKHLMN